jgi:hypothetical protein
MLQTLFLAQDNTKTRDVNIIKYNRYFKEREFLLENEGFFLSFLQSVLTVIHKVGTYFFKFLFTN